MTTLIIRNVSGSTGDFELEVSPEQEAQAAAVVEHSYDNSGARARYERELADREANSFVAPNDRVY